jgi:hypothetical protein
VQRMDVSVAIRSGRSRPTGEFRVQGTNEVRVKRRGMRMHLSEKEYRASGYDPDFDQLPWSSDPRVLIPAMPNGPKGKKSAGRRDWQRQTRSKDRDT